MKLHFGAIFGIAILAALPGAALAQQQHPEATHHPASHPAAHAPAMRAPERAPQPSFRRTAPRPTTHHVTRRVIHRSTVHNRIVHKRVVNHIRNVHRVVHHSARVARLRRNVHARHRFHAGIYRAPRGYRYRRWHFGQFLPGIYWNRNYWITDFLAFGLFAPPPGYVWVRFGPDALLIDEYTGEIIQVDYGVFF